MNYKEEVTKAYEESMRAYGYSERVITLALIGFDTGFSAGTYNGSDVEEQVKMLNKLLNEEVMN